MTTIDIPKNIDDLDGSLAGCDNLTTINVDNDNETFVSNKEALYSKDYTTLYKWLDTNIKNLTINELTTSIEDNAFSNLENLEKINTKNVTNIKR